MKKIIALALALVLALSMASVAFAQDYDGGAYTYAPGEKIVVADGLITAAGATGWDGAAAKSAMKSAFKVSYDFTTGDWCGASMIDSIEITKDNDLVITLKENYTMIDAKDLKGAITLTNKTTKVESIIYVEVSVNNEKKLIEGVKKADNADNIWALMEKNNVLFAEDAGGYVKFDDGVALAGTVKVAEDEKAQVYVIGKVQTEKDDEDLVDAIDAYLGEDYDGIVEWYNFCGTGFKADVDFQYDAYAEDPHYFYQWDGEKLVDLKAKFNDDEDVEKYEFTAAAKGVILVTDVEVVAAAAEEETKNPDTGANDVVGVAAALAVVSLVAAGAVSLKK